MKTKNNDLRILKNSFRGQKEFCQQERKKIKELLQGTSPIFLCIAFIFPIFAFMMDILNKRPVNNYTLAMYVTLSITFFDVLYLIISLGIHKEFFEEYKNLLETKKKIKNILYSKKESSHAI